MEAKRMMTYEDIEQKKKDFINDPFLKQCRKRLQDIYERYGMYEGKWDMNTGEWEFKTVFPSDVQQYIDNLQKQIQDYIDTYYGKYLNQPNND